MPMESRVKVLNPQIIPRASQKSSLAAFPYETEMVMNSNSNNIVIVKNK